MKINTTRSHTTTPIQYFESKDSHRFTQISFQQVLKGSRILVCILLLSPPLALAEIRIDSHTRIDQSLRLDDLRWNIAGPGNSPNIFSETTWNDLWSYQVSLASETLINDRFYLQGSVGFAYVFNGDNQESFYTLNNRQSEYSRSINDAADSDFQDFNVSGGYTFSIMDRNVSRNLLLIPQVGFSVQMQNLVMADGKQVLSNSPSTIPLGSINGLNNSYQTSWYGPWVGVDLRFESTDRTALNMKFTYHEVDYFAEADWNLRNDLAHPVSFEHDAKGTGKVFSVGWREEFWGSWVFGLSFSYQEWVTERGSNLIFNANGSRSSTVLNEVVWRSSAVTLSIGRFFLGQ